jgi:hypothetical protein
MPEAQPIEYKGYPLVNEPCAMPEPPGNARMLWVLKNPDGTNVTLPGSSAPALGFATLESAKHTIDAMEDLRAEGHPVTFDAVSRRWLEREGLWAILHRLS